MTQPQLRGDEAELSIKSVCGGDREAFYELIRLRMEPFQFTAATAMSVLKTPPDAWRMSRRSAVLKALSNLAGFPCWNPKFSTTSLRSRYVQQKQMNIEEAHAPHSEFH